MPVPTNQEWIDSTRTQMTTIGEQMDEMEADPSKAYDAICEVLDVLCTAKEATELQKNNNLPAQPG